MHRSALAAVAVTLWLAPDASALTLTLDHVSGEWSNAVGAPAIFPVVGDEAQVRWGTDIGNGQSGLGFSGRQQVPVDLVPGAEFEIGTLRHFNNPVLAPTVTAVDLGLTLEFRDLASQQTFTFHITETPNLAPCPFPGVTPCTDLIQFPTAFSTQTFQFEGRSLSLEIVGFRTTPGGPVVTEFLSEEQQTNSAVLVGRIHVLDGGCTLTQGYWKNHPEAWPVSSLTLGARAYSMAELLAIFGQPVRGNGLVSLAHQLIAAKLNRANFAASPDAVEDAITAADALIGALVVPPIGAGRLPPAAASPLVSQLDGYNSGQGGPPECR